MCFLLKQNYAIVIIIIIVFIIAVIVLLVLNTVDEQFLLYLSFALYSWHPLYLSLVCC